MFWMWHLVEMDNLFIVLTVDNGVFTTIIIVSVHYHNGHCHAIRDAINFIIIMNIISLVTFSSLF